MNNIEKLIYKIFHEEDTPTTTISELKFKDGLTSNIQILTKDNVSFYITIFIELDKLENVNDNYQIELYSKLKSNNMNDIFDGDTLIKLNTSFNKHTTLIILTNGENDFLTRKIISSVEENPYYFKKQIISISNSEIDFCNELIDSNNARDACEEIINNVDEFKKFSYSNSPSYSLVAKMYEKIPFFTLQVPSENSDDLYGNILSSLTEEQRCSVVKYNDLDESKISYWLDSIGNNHD